MKIPIAQPRRRRAVPIAGLAAALFLGLAALAGSPAWAADDFNLSQAKPIPNGMCAGQDPITEKELAQALAVMDEIINLGGQLSPADEETFIRGQGLTSDRLNCVLGKFMAGNDIFGWGPPEAYGVNLTPPELAAARKFAGQSGKLKKYMEESLNLQVETN